MGKKLVIVESPAKAKTINKYLGKDYIVKSSVGHIRDLPTGKQEALLTPKERAARTKKEKTLPDDERARLKRERAARALVRKMGVDPDNNWAATYQVLDSKKKVVKELREAAAKSDEIFLATDLDREGEAIAWHLRETIGGDESIYKRVIFNEITKKAIQEAFEKPTELDMNRVNAQQARRFLDRVVGFNLSPLLWKKVARSLSAGRVQSVAVELIVQREREIRAFVAEEYWRMHATMNGAGQDFHGEVKKMDGKEYRPGSQAESDAALAILQANEFKIVKREDKPTRSKPRAPFITSTLQQAASTSLGFGVKKTMMLAQRLYEAGHITYMRTDSTNLSGEAVTAARELIESDYGKEYLLDEPRTYSSKESAQEAHEAIRPSSANANPSSLDKLERDQQRLYDLIWRRFIACQMPDAEYLSSGVTIAVDKYEISARGRVMKFDGWLKVIPPTARKEGDQVLPDVKEGDVVKRVLLEPAQHFTKPTARYSEAALVKDLESKGIGRPSTYAETISKIQDRGYVSLRNRRFYAEKIGEIVTDRLSACFPRLMDYQFTSSLEDQLDQIAQGQASWLAVLDEYYADFKTKLEKAEGLNGSDGMTPNDPVEVDIDCPKCGRKMAVRTGATGMFLSCTGYALPKAEQCKQTLPLTDGCEARNAESEEEEAAAQRAKRRCPKCESAMDEHLVDEKRKLWVCGHIPDCDFSEIENGTFIIKGYEGPLIECDKCGADMQLKNGRFGKYFGCTGEVEGEPCKNTRKLLRSGEAAPPKADPVPMPELACQKVEDYYLLRDGAAGIFLAASKYPKHRETRAPKIVEILPHKDELDPKFLYLCDAPPKDPEGNLAVVRWRRKLKKQYVMSENAEGKATGWEANYEDGKWKQQYTKGPKKGPVK